MNLLRSALLPGLLADCAWPLPYPPPVQLWVVFGSPLAAHFFVREVLVRQ
jgi:hypothetical protein